MAYKRISTKLPFYSGDIYNIIIDVASYPEFIPHCNAIEIHEQSEIEIVATMHINFLTHHKSLLMQAPIRFLLRNIQKSFLRFLKIFGRFAQRLMAAKLFTILNLKLKTHF